jgi:hypothetical protein
VLNLAQGLVGKTSDPEALLREVLNWTGGQPFLTQKLCKLIQESGEFSNNPKSKFQNPESSISVGRETQWVETLVREAKLSMLVES